LRVNRERPDGSRTAWSLPLWWCKGGNAMNLHTDYGTAHTNVESRRLWNDVRVWVVNCYAVEAAVAALPSGERADARRGCDRMLAAFLQVW
jgi:hypothetical protein